MTDTTSSRWQQAVFYDLDSTVADTRQRRHLCPMHNPSATWEEYALACAQDEPMMASILVIRAFAELGHSCHAVSGRSAVADNLTQVWLTKHDVPCHSQWLRPQGDQRDSALVKLDRVANLQAMGYAPYLFLEDLPSVSQSLSVVVSVLTVNPLYSD